MSKIINHAKYDANGAPLNDITLLKLSEKVDMKKYSPVCLPDAASTYVGKNADVYGKFAFLLDSYSCLILIHN